MIKKIFKWIAIGFGGLVVLSVMLAIIQGGSGNSGSSQSAKNTVANAPAPPPPPPAPAYEFETTPNELATAYDENTVRADTKFKGKKYLVTGLVADISTDVMGDAYLVLRGGVNQFMQPHFTLQDSEKNKAGDLKKGQKVSLICIGGGDVAKIPMSKRCAFAS